MLNDIAPGSLLAVELLAISLLLVLAFEFSNGFHDTANAVATVIYSRALKPLVAVVLSGTLNFAGVLLGGLAVAFTLIDLIPPDVLTPPDGNPGLGMPCRERASSRAPSRRSYSPGFSHCPRRS